MCLKPQPSRPMPADTKAMVGRMLDEDTVYRFVGDVLFDRFHDEDFADLYPKTGQPALSPVLLSFVLIFKALERCSNRQAANNLRFRLDWKYALHLPLDYAGFDQNVLAEFRHRLLANGVEARIFNAIFKELRDLGYYQPRGIQRTDSIAIHTHCRDLRRIELMVETLRKAVHDLLRAAPDWTQATLPGVWEERYAQPCKSERMKEDERQALAVTVGDDGQWLLDRLEQDDAADLRAIDAINSLRDVWSRHYREDADGHMRWNDDGERGGSQVIETPYDPEARWATKRTQSWVGYKLQVTETDDPDTPHLITDIALTPATETDFTALDDIRARQKARDVLPGERYADSGYISGPNIKDGRENYGEELIGPIREAHIPQDKIPGGLTQADFQIDWEGKQVTYNGDGVLVQAGATHYTQDLAAPLSQVLNDGSASYIYGLDRLTSSAGEWYLGNALGSVRKTLDSTGAVTAAASYDPWGMPTSGMIAPFGFTGEVQDSAGQVYLRARWYDPTSGTFPGYRSFSTEAWDTIPSSYHPYAYALSNPVVYSDPTGKYYQDDDQGRRCIPPMRWDNGLNTCVIDIKPPPPNNPAPEEPQPQPVQDPIKNLLTGNDDRDNLTGVLPRPGGLSDEDTARLINTLGLLCLIGADTVAQSQNKPHDRSDEKEIVYRNPAKGEHPNALVVGFYPKDSSADQTVRNHVRLGSKIKTQFISLTKSINVARRYQSLENGPIYAINLKKVAGTVIDLTVPSVIDAYIAPSDTITRNFATASEEVLVLGYIPPNAIEGTIGFMEVNP